MFMKHVCACIITAHAIMIVLLSLVTDDDIISFYFQVYSSIFALNGHIRIHGGR